MRISDCSCWTGSDAAFTGSATIRDRFIWRQFKCRQNLRQKKPRPEPFTYQHRILSMPTDAGLRCVVSLQNRTCIDVKFLSSAELPEKAVDIVELRCDHIVVIIAPGVPRDLARFRCSCGAVRRVSLKIIQRQDDDRPRT